MRHRVQRIALLSVIALSTQMLWAGAAEAKEFRLPEASIVATVRSDGAIAVTERLTYSFDGGFSGAYREIPLTGGVEVGDVSVSEADQTYRPGAPTELGSSGFPGTFGVADLGDRTRIVWHYGAQDERRTFTVRYVLTNLTVAYDDVVDINLRVWGDEWQVPL